MYARSVTACNTVCDREGAVYQYVWEVGLVNCVCLAVGWAIKVGGLGVAGHPEPMGLRVYVHQSTCCEVSMLHSTVDN